MPVFSGDGKVEMVGSDSKHEFPRCDGHVGRILRNNRCKKNRLVRSVFYCSVTEWVALVGKELSITDL